jgi:hypothetical protein
LYDYIGGIFIDTCFNCFIDYTTLQLIGDVAQGSILSQEVKESEEIEIEPFNSAFTGEIINSEQEDYLLERDITS